MEYELFLLSIYEAEYIAKMLIDSDTSLDFEMKVYEGSRVYIGCSYFSIDIDLEDVDDDMKEYHEMNMRYHSVNTNMRISIQMISKTFNTGWLEFLKLLGGILRSIEGDLLLLDDTSFPVMKRIDNILYINSNLDEYKVKYITKENLKLLNYPFIERSFLKEE